MWPLRVQAFQFGHQRMLFKWNELRTQKSYFRLSMQLFTRYAVFLSVVGHLSELFRHRGKPNVSVTPSLAKFFLQMHN